MRLAWVSPLPPMASGIADYSFELLPLLARAAEVDAVCPRIGWFRRPHAPSAVPVLTPERFERRAHEYDAVFYHLGNNPFHEFVYDMALRRPGIAVFHEFVLHHLIAHLMVESQREPPRYEGLLRAEYGDVGLRLADLRLRGVATDFEKFLFPLTGHVARGSRAIIVHSKATAERMEELAPSLPVSVIPHHAGNPPRSAAGMDRVRARRLLGLPADGFIAGQFGYITRPKNPAAVIGGFARVVAAHPDARLLLVGADHSGGGLDRLIERHGLRDRVRLTGFVDLDRFYLCLKAVDAVISLRYPSAGESSGTLARALAEGLPIIVNNLGSFGELPDDVALKVDIDEDQTDGVARHLLRLAGDPGYRAEVGAAARRYAATVLDPRRCRDLYLAVARQASSHVPASQLTETEDASEAAASGAPRWGWVVPASPSGRVKEIRGAADPKDSALAMPVREENLPFIERIAAESLPPSGAATYMDLLYRLLLGRPVEEHALRSAVLSLAAGETNRAELAKWIIQSREFREAELIGKTLTEVRRHPQPFTIPADDVIGKDTTERVVEIPWVLSRWRGEQRLLDLGYAYANGVYLSALLGLPIEHLHGVDWSAAQAPGMIRTRADLRALPYRDASFDLVICISTIEHVGMDNARYGLTGRQAEGGDSAALREIERVLRPEGRLLITVPFGRREDHGWFVQFDTERWVELCSTAPSLRLEEQVIYHITEHGWTLAQDVRNLERLSYGVDAPAARGVLCAELVKLGPVT